jgi:hypothetical protein
VRALSALRSSNILLTTGLSSSLINAVSTVIPFGAQRIFVDEEGGEVVGDAVEFIDGPRRNVTEVWGS